MGDSKTAAEPRYLRRLTHEGSGVVTINIRSSRVLLFWSSHDLLVPIEPGWYFHAASMSGRASVVDGERRLDADFDLADPKVRWQHAKIVRLGRADLFLDTGRRYAFYLTANQASRDVLLRHHLAWPFQLRSPKSKGEPTVVVFQAWPLQLDYHRDEDRAITPKGEHRDQSLLSFDSWEHESTAEARTSDGRSLQDMIDMWAFRGLIDGGAMIDTHGTFETWNVWCPWEERSATPNNPYGVDPLVPADILKGTWHYVIPEKQRDPQTKMERPWTGSALKAAIGWGRAVALTIGQAIMLGGDDFEIPAEMENDTDRWKDPRNIMRVYWAARQWLEAQKTAIASGRDIYWWHGYLQRYGVVYLVFELLMSNPSALGKPTTADEMEAVGKGEVGSEIKIPAELPERLKEDDPYAKNQMAWLKSAFDNLVARARKVDAMVDLLRQASGASRFTEIHFLAQTLTTAAQGKGGTLGWMQSRLPWLTHLHPQHDLSNAGFTQNEIDWFENNGVDDQLMQIVGTNGSYGDLGLKNWTHFSDGGLNFQTFETFHRKALALVVQHGSAPDAAHPIPAQALFLTAFGCHFFTDAFSASHMRVPRKKLGAFSAKLMHDVDGLVGLWVYSDDPVDPQIWYAFGDTYLHSKNLSAKQMQLLPHRWGKRTPEVDPQLNFEFAAAAVGSAFKQLHYQAHALRQSEPKPPGLSPASPTLQNILDSNGPIAGGWGADERRGLEDIVDDGPPPGDFTKAMYLRNESLAPGKAGPPRKTMWEHLRMTVDNRIGFLKSLVPIPLPTATEAPRFGEYGSPVSIYEKVNIPPLFTKDGKVNLGKDNPYDIVTGAGNALRGFTHYAGFSLRVNWGPFGDFSVDDAELRLNYDKYYFMTKFFKDVQGLEAFMDTTLLDVFDKLPKEKA